MGLIAGHRSLWEAASCVSHVGVSSVTQLSVQPPPKRFPHVRRERAVDDYRADDDTKHTDLAACQAEVEHLRAMLRSRSAIEQAKGILMGRHGCSPDRAFAMLSAASQRSNRKLHAVAEAIVDSVQEKVHQDAAG